MSSDEIADFIRRAAARRQQQQQGRPAPAPPPPAPAPPQQQRPPSRRPAAPMEPEIVEVQLVENQGGLSHRDAHLADDIEQTDERMEAHLHTAFDHQLGSLDSSTEVASIKEFSYDDKPVEKKGLAHDLLAMFRSKTDVRKAILMSEIFQRPEQRW
ncbi:hypothetical protein [Lignipirellula cremea]|uniref:Uncharacterized protein n=1 Tax=Lignipirellula cremea TaxID=2528010 RepID=A0A518DSR4_9BACT|nr:hypothetical protein [Lignipirellula cremea]QDU94882.1 hypothetical protein Pla8534_26900 [Lignipirellula cremea]